MISFKFCKRGHQSRVSQNPRILMLKNLIVFSKWIGECSFRPHHAIFCSVQKNMKRHDSINVDIDKDPNSKIFSNWCPKHFGWKELFSHFFSISLAFVVTFLSHCGDICWGNRFSRVLFSFSPHQWKSISSILFVVILLCSRFLQLHCSVS